MTKRIEELEAKLASATNLRQRIDLMNELAQGLRFTDLPRAIALAQEARELTGQGELEAELYREGLAESLCNLGVFGVQMGHYDAALSLLLRSLSLFDELEDPAGMARALNALGALYAYLGGYPDALDHFFKVLELYRVADLREEEAAPLNNIGFIYLCLGDEAKALTYLHESLQVAQETENREVEADALDSICRACHLREDYETALIYGLRSVLLHRQIGALRGEAEALNNVGEVYRAQGDTVRALESFDKALRLSEEIGLRVEAARALRGMGEVHLRKEAAGIEMALSCLHRALAIAGEIQAKEEQYRCQRILAETHKRADEFEKALAHYEQFHALKEELFNEEADARLRNLEVVQEVETARREVEIHQLRNVAMREEIRERQKAEAALQRANAQLQQEIAAREQLIAELDAFAHTVAHDLKAPLNLITGYSDMLRYALGEDEGRESLKFVDLIINAGLKMGNIIDDILMLASVRQQDVTLQPLDMAQIVHEVEGRLSQVIAEHRAEIVKPAAWPEALGYPPWVEEVWVNYISNAIKYGGAPPRVELGAAAQPGGQVRFWVRDNGDGLSAEAQAQLFTAFTRIDQTHVKGHGLGLSIVRRIVDKLGGQVAVESEGLPGRGSVFSFTLPSAVQENR